MTQIEVVDPTAIELFKQELTSLERRNHDEIVYSCPFPAVDGYQPLILHLFSGGMSAGEGSPRSSASLRN